MRPAAVRGRGFEGTYSVVRADWSPPIHTSRHCDHVCPRHSQARSAPEGGFIAVQADHHVDFVAAGHLAPEVDLELLRGSRARERARGSGEGGGEERGSRGSALAIQLWLVRPSKASCTSQKLILSFCGCPQGEGEE